MTTQSGQTLILRDSAGNFYLVSGETVEAGRVPADKAAALQQAISGESGEVSGYIFDLTFQNALTSLRQGNTNVGSNVVAGGLVGLNNQSLSQLGVNIGSASTTQAKL